MPEKRLQLEVLSDESLARIEATAFRLLDEVGIAVDHPRATEMLHGLGCRIEGGRVLAPPDVVHWAVKNVTPHRQVYGLDGEPAFRLGDGRVRFHSGGALPFLLDLESGGRRRPTREDIAAATRVLDALPHVDMMLPLFGAQDVPPELLAAASTEVMLRHTRKPAWAAPIDRPEDVAPVVEMAAACCGGREAFRQRPTLLLAVSPVSPLHFTERVTASIMAVAESGAPFLPLPAPSLGATGPVTMAGAVAQQHAETLASYLIAAATRPGVPVIYCSRISSIDLRTAISIWGGPEVGLSGAIAGQLAHRLGLPCDSYGLSSSSPALDPQFGYERLANALIPALAGVDLLSGMGSTENVMIAAAEIAVLDDEMASLIKQIVGGCEVSDTSLAFEVMDKVIPRDGVFLAEMHTARQVRRGGLWIPRLSVRGGSETRETVVDRARARVREILATHLFEPLPDDVSRHLDEIMVQARRDLVKD